MAHETDTTLHYGPVCSSTCGMYQYTLVMEHKVIIIYI